jgi:hypothetical protein
MDDQVRTMFHDALARSDNEATRALAEVVTGQVNGQLACWGDLVDYVRAHFEKDEDSLALWRVLNAVGDRRPQLLFLDVHRARPTILRALLADATHIAPIVQCALVSMPEAEPLIATPPAGLAPAAREIATSAPAIRLEERAVYETQMSSLRTQRASVPYAEATVLRHLSELVLPLRAPVEAPPVAAPNAPASPAVAPATHASQLITEAGQVLRPGGLP